MLAVLNLNPSHGDSKVLYHSCSRYVWSSSCWWYSCCFQGQDKKVHSNDSPCYTTFGRITETWLQRHNGNVIFDNCDVVPGLWGLLATWIVQFAHQPLTLRCNHISQPQPEAKTPLIAHFNTTQSPFTFLQHVYVTITSTLFLSMLYSKFCRPYDLKTLNPWKSEMHRTW